MRVWLLLCLCWTVPLLAQKKSDPCAMEKLPIGVQQMLNSRYPDLRPKTVSDLEGYDRKLWLSSHPHSCPGIALGSFEQPHQRAYAVLLVPKSATQEQYKVVVIAEPQSSSEYQVKLLEQGTSTANSGLVISRVPPGEQTGFDESESVNLKLDGINVEWLEKASVLYYYSNGSYRQLETSD